MSTRVQTNDFTLPDSELAQKATRLVAELSPPFLYHHCVRTYLFGDELGRREGFTYDRELLYLSAIMHDLGLTERFDGNQRFEVEGADAARSFLLEQGVTAEKTEIVWDAIALHSSIGIASRKRPEIALVHFGAGMDVFGLRAGDIPSEVVEKIIVAYPRLEFKNAMIQVLLGQIHRKPQLAALTWLSEVGRSYLPEFAGLNWKELMRNSPYTE